MEFLGDVFVKFWKEAIVAVLLTAVLPFIRMYVRRQRAKMINFFKDKKRLEEALREVQEKRKEAEERAEREHQAREEAERINLELKTEIDSLRDELTRAQKAHEEAERLLNAAKEAERFRAEEWRKAQNEAESLRSELERLKSEPKPEPKETITDSEEEYELARGYHSERDYDKALEHYLIAAKLGHTKAQCTLGFLYYYGIGVTENKPEGTKWYRKAAMQGDAQAQRMLDYLNL